MIKDSTRVFLDELVTRHLGGAGYPPELLAELADVRASATWDSYVGAIRPWFAHAEASGVTALPADPGLFASWLVSVGRDDRSYAPTKLRCCAISCLSTLARVPTPTVDPRVSTLRSLYSRKKAFRRGSVTLVLRAEIPRIPVEPPMELGPRSPPAPRRAGRAGPSPGTRHRQRAATAAFMGFLHDGVLRYDDTREGQLGDLSFYPDATEVGVFGSKTDKFHTGQTAQLPPASDDAGGAVGASALVEVVRAGLRRLRGLAPATLSILATRLAAVFPRDTPQPGAMAAWPPDVQDLARPLYEHGVLVHCLPYFGSWLWLPLSADTDLTATLSTRQFARLSSQLVTEAGGPATGIGAHSFRRGGSTELLHGGLDLPTLSLALRHASLASTKPYLLQSALTASTAAAMRGAARRSRGPGRRHRPPAASAPSLRRPHGVPGGLPPGDAHDPQDWPRPPGGLRNHGPLVHPPGLGGPLGLPPAPLLAEWQLPPRSGSPRGPLLPPMAPPPQPPGYFPGQLLPAFAVNRHGL